MIIIIIIIIIIFIIIFIIIIIIINIIIIEYKYPDPWIEVLRSCICNNYILLILNVGWMEVQPAQMYCIYAINLEGFDQRYFSIF